MNSRHDDGALSIQVGQRRHILLVRHGETDWNVAWRIQSRLDIKLNARGTGQMTETGARIAAALPAERTVSIWSSPVARAVQSAQIVSDACARDGLEMPPLRLHEGITEFDMGNLTGQTLGQLRQQPVWKEYVSDPENAVFPSGESMVSIRDRSFSGIRAIMDSDPAEVVVVVSHGGIIRILATGFLGMPLSSLHRLYVANASVTHVRITPPDRARMQAINATDAGFELD